MLAQTSLRFLFHFFFSGLGFRACSAFSLGLGARWFRVSGLDDGVVLGFRAWMMEWF
jgi:hypothetical protein